MSEKAYFFHQQESIEIKKTIAQLLYDQDVEQSKISSILGLSQPMVSHYCGSKKTTNKQIIIQANTIVKQILKGELIQCQQCIIFSQNPIKGLYYIGDKYELIDDENRYIIKHLMQAFITIKDHNLSGYLPKIKINIIQAKHYASKSEDIAAFVNGLIISDDVIIGHNGIRFGCSTHLSSLLLSLQEKLDIHAIMNIAYISEIKDPSLSVAYLDKDFKLTSKQQDIDILLHKGDFGIEPCTYILGKDAVDVTDKLLKIID